MGLDFLPLLSEPLQGRATLGDLLPLVAAERPDLRRAVLADLPTSAQAAESDIDERLAAFIRAVVIQGMGRYRMEPLTRHCEHPFVSRPARDYAADLPEGQAVHTFNAWHEPVVLDAAAQFLLPHLDGSHPRADLLAMLQQAANDGALAIAQNASAPGRDGHGSLAAELDRVLTLLCA